MPHPKKTARRITKIFGLLAAILGTSGAVADESRISLADAGAAVAESPASGTPAAQPAGDGYSEQPAKEPAAAAAPSAWPPGLMMQGLDAIGLGKPMQDLGLRAYGFVEAGMTFKMKGPFPNRRGLPLRGFDSRRPGNVRLNQLYFTLDRPVDTSKNFDMGGRVDFLYGTDAKLLHSLGMFDTNQLHHDVNYDITQGYGEMWFKTGPNGQGFDITFGKWFTPIGAETSAYAVVNWLYSRSLLNAFAEPSIHTGLKLAYFFDPNNSVYMAVVRGWDQFKDANQMASWMAGFTLSGKEQMGSNPRSQLLFNFIIGPEQAGKYVGENRLLADTVWIWRWSEKLTQNVNFDFGWEADVPGALNSEKVPHRADAAWYGLSYMLNYVINDYVQATGRAEWFTDNAGVRTGYRGTFFETTAGLSIIPFPKDKVLSNFMFRPELRADWSSNDAPFAHDCQITGAFDIIYKF